MATGAERASLIGGAVLLVLSRKGLLEAARMPFAKTVGNAVEHPPQKTLFGVAVLWACDKIVARLSVHMLYKQHSSISR